MKAWHLIFAVTIAVSSWAASADELRIWISTSAQTNIISKIKVPFEKQTGIKLISVGDNKKVSGPTYFKDVVTGMAEAATNSLNFEDWADEARKSAGVTDAEVAQITQRVIGHDIMKIYCNKANGVSGLSLEQIQSVFTGKNKNWKELGGTDVPIKLVFPSIKVTTFAAFRKMALHNEEIKATLVDAKDYDDMIAISSKMPGSCAFGGSRSSVEDLVVMATPQIGRPTVLITKGKPSDKVQKLVDFIRTEGPKYGVER